MALSILATDRAAADKLISAVLPLADWWNAFRTTEEAHRVKVLLMPQILD